MTTTNKLPESTNTGSKAIEELDGLQLESYLDWLYPPDLQVQGARTEVNKPVGDSVCGAWLRQERIIQCEVVTDDGHFFSCAHCGKTYNPKPTEAVKSWEEKANQYADNLIGNDSAVYGYENGEGRYSEGQIRAAVNFGYRVCRADMENELAELKADVAVKREIIVKTLALNEELLNERDKLTADRTALVEALRKAVLFGEMVIGKKRDVINYSYLNAAREVLKAIGEG